MRIGMDISLADKVALITGTGPNIGSGIALVLSKYGAKIACNDAAPEVAEAAVRRVERNGGIAMAIPGDVTSDSDVQGYAQKVLDTWGKIDILVNNAAILRGKSVLEENVEDFERYVRVAATGNFLNTKYVAKSMIERGIKGSIFCIISASGWQGHPGNISYAFHKGGLINFVRSAAMDLAPYGIRVNSYTPTTIRPDNPELIAANRDRGGAYAGPIEWATRMIPMGEQPTPTDCGHLIAWISSDFARLVTGCDFVADGGARAKYWAYTPPEGAVGPLPLVNLDSTRLD
jgi:NAD(P)-dependent dehydrogenase (short-subunit alcohol dehydrogenase family)